MQECGGKGQAAGAASYPLSRIISMRSCSGPGMVSTRLAVQMNSTCCITGGHSNNATHHHITHAIQPGSAAGKDLDVMCGSTSELALETSTGTSR